jgi:hypothetical protein
MWDKLIRIDRRWIFLVIAVVVTAPFIFGWTLPLGSVSPPTQALYQFIEKLPPRSPVIISFDYGPASMPELQPMAEALARHVLKRKLRLIGMSLWPPGPMLCERAFRSAAAEVGAREGHEWVNLGYKPGEVSVILGMGTDITKVYSADYRKVPVAELPVMSGVRSYKDVALVVVLAAGVSPGEWVRFAQARFGQTLAVGCTAVMATDVYPYLQSKQLVGVINGLKGAAEYEALVAHRGMASLGMTSQSIGHIGIIVFVIIGNIGYFATRWRRR